MKKSEGKKDREKNNEVGSEESEAGWNDGI